MSLVHYSDSSSGTDSEGEIDNEQENGHKNESKDKNEGTSNVDDRLGNTLEMVSNRFAFVPLKKNTGFTMSSGGCCQEQLTTFVSLQFMPTANWITYIEKLQGYLKSQFPSLAVVNLAINELTQAPQKLHITLCPNLPLTSSLKKLLDFRTSTHEVLELRVPLQPVIFGEKFVVLALKKPYPFKIRQLLKELATYHPGIESQMLHVSVLELLPENEKLPTNQVFPPDICSPTKELIAVCKTTFNAGRSLIS